MILTLAQNEALRQLYAAADQAIAILVLGGHVITADQLLRARVAIRIEFQQEESK